MDNNQNVQHVLKEFGKIIDLEALQLDEQGSCRLIFDEDIEVIFELDDASNSLLLISPVAQATADLYADLLELNLFWGQLKGCRFILLNELGTIATMRRIPSAGLDIIGFEKTLEEFVDTSATWKKAFEKAASEKKQETPAKSTDARSWNAHHITGRA